LLLPTCYSRRSYAMAFFRHCEEAFFAGHMAAFEELGTIPRKITYDNLTLAVKRALTASRRKSGTWWPPVPTSSQY